MRSSRVKLSYKGVSFIREDRRILDSVDLQIKEGEQWAILGTNGSGKSTLLSFITAYNVPSQGSVTVLGREFGKSRWSEVKERTGYYSSVLEKFNETLYPMNVRDIVLSGHTSTVGIFGEPAEDVYRATEETLKEFQLGPLRDQKFRHLSQGQKRKVLVARAMARKPELLILDEPCAGLDLRAREEVLRSIEGIGKRGLTTLLLVTHSMEEIVPSISHICLLKDGKVFRTGCKEEILKDEIISEAYDWPLEVRKIRDRYYAFTKG